MIAGGEVGPKTHQPLKPGCLGVALIPGWRQCLAGFTTVRLLGIGEIATLKLRHRLEKRRLKHLYC
jgi:hypothetical protein